MIQGHIVTVSSKGQITLPVSERKNIPYKKFLLERKGSMIVLKPIEIKVIKEKNDELEDFHKLSETSFDFWNDPEENIWDTFYKDNAPAR